MNDSSDLLCEERGPDGLRCTMPFNHGGDTHSFEIELPPNVAAMVASYIDHLEQMETQRARSLWLLKRARWAMYAAFCVNLIAAVWNIASILS